MNSTCTPEIDYTTYTNWGLSSLALLEQALGYREKEPHSTLQLIFFIIGTIYRWFKNIFSKRIDVPEITLSDPNGHVRQLTEIQLI